MAFLDRISNAWASMTGRQKIFGELASGSSGESLLSGVLSQGMAPRRGTVELMQSYKDLPWLRAVIDKISHGIATTRWMVVRSGDTSLQEVPNHPIIDLLNSWNPALTGYASWQTCQAMVELKGEAFIMVERDGMGTPTELYPIPPHWVREIPTKKKPFYNVQFNSFSRNIPEADMIWVKNSDPLNPYGRGTGVAESLADELDSDEYAAKHIKSFFYNRAMPDLMVGVRGASKESLQRASTAWDNKHRGIHRQHRIHFHSGEIDVKQLNHSFAENQLVSLRQFERDTIIQVFGLPPEILGVLESSNRATIETADFLFAQWVLTPRLEFWRTELNAKLVPMFGPGIELMFESPVSSDKDHALKVSEAHPHAFTINEVREMAGKPPEEGGELHAVHAGVSFKATLEETEEIEEVQDEPNFDIDVEEEAPNDKE